MFSAYLWGIETNTAWRGGTARLPVFSVPMRNWNKQYGKRDRGKKTVFSVPMRNWNQGRTPRIFFSNRGFQRTYEELKPAQSRIAFNTTFRFSAYLWGIETGLVGHGVGQWWKGFQRTYEELKRTESWKHTRTGPVFSVPMRNWNTCRAMLLFYLDGFSAYLWGIETIRGLQQLVNQFLFSAYLWGIETQRINLHQRHNRSFSAYLWGIETFPFPW